MLVWIGPVWILVMVLVSSCVFCYLGDMLSIDDDDGDAAVEARIR